MIKKFLIVGKNLYLQTKQPKSYEELGTLVELKLPIEEYWSLRNEFEKLEYLEAAGEIRTEVSSQKRTVLKICSKWALSEKDRNWLFNLLKEND
jgi:hypothetical protein